MNLFDKTISFLKTIENIKINKTKNGYFFYRGLIEENKGRFRVFGKIEYRTGYKYETYVGLTDMDLFNNNKNEEIECLLLDLGFNEKETKEAIAKIGSEL